MQEKKQIKNPHDAIDAIVTWVDGNDPAHINKRNKALAVNPNRQSSTIPAGTDHTRFENNNEIEYCLRSIRKFAPWIRTIFLITDQQHPKFLTQQEQQKLRVKVIDHCEIFKGYEEALPTFNSLSIETALHRVPDLAPKYIYLNDDFILLGPTQASDFFTSDGVVLRGEWKRLKNFSSCRLWISKKINYIAKKTLGINRAMSALQQMKGAKIAGARDHYFNAAHTPYPVRKETIESFMTKNPKIFKENISYKFRDLNQYATTALSNHLEIIRKKAETNASNDHIMICFNRDRKSQIRKKIELLNSKNIKFLCLQSLEQASDMSRKELIDTLKSRILN